MNRRTVRFKDIAPLLVVAFQNWQDDRVPRMGAALAYYMALSLAPTVLVLLAIVEWLFGTEASSGRFMPQFQQFMGFDGSRAILTMIESTHQSSRGVAATFLGLVTVFFAGSAVVSELRDSMNTIWKVPGGSGSGEFRTIVNLVEDRILSFALVLALGLFLLASLILNTWIFAVGKFLNSGTVLPAALVQVTDWVISFAIITALFAFTFKVLPRVPLYWSDVSAGAVGTALLFVAGKVLLGVYLGKAGFSNTYGAAGSLVVVLVWVYYSAQVLYLGAEFTRAYAYRFGSMYGHGNGYSGL